MRFNIYAVIIILFSVELWKYREEIYGIAMDICSLLRCSHHLLRSILRMPSQSILAHLNRYQYLTHNYMRSLMETANGFSCSVIPRNLFTIKRVEIECDEYKKIKVFPFLARITSIVKLTMQHQQQRGGVYKVNFF